MHAVLEAAGEGGEGGNAGEHLLACPPRSPFPAAPSRMWRRRRRAAAAAPSRSGARTSSRCSTAPTCWPAPVSGLRGWLLACLATALPCLTPRRPLLLLPSTSPLLSPLSTAATADLAEMRASITAALEKCSGAGGWQLELVGGSRRQERPPPPGGVAADDDTPHHDADFIASHPTLKWGDNLLDRCVEGSSSSSWQARGGTGQRCRRR